MTVNRIGTHYPRDAQPVIFPKPIRRARLKGHSHVRGTQSLQPDPEHTIEGMVQQYLEDEPQALLFHKFELAKRSGPYALTQFMREEFGMNLRHVGQHNGEDDFEQI